MFAATGILFVILMVQFLRTTPETFAAAMDSFSFAVDGREGYYQWIQKDVADAGVNLAPAIAFGAILLATPIVWTSLQWATYSVQQGGEIKGARVFKNQMFIIVGSMVAVGVCSRASRLGSGARGGHRVLQRRLALLLLPGECVRGRCRQRLALPGHVRDRDLAQPDHHDPGRGELHARVAADHLQLLHRHDPHPRRHVARPHAAGVGLQDQPAVPLAGQRALALPGPQHPGHPRATTTGVSGTR